jgi:hypothetical protein
MGIMDYLFGKKERMQQVPTMTGQQNDLLSQFLSQLQSGGNGMDYFQKILSGDTEAFEKPLMNQFYSETLPSLSEQFSNFGQGSQQSSAFGQQMGQAGAGLAQNLGAMRGGLQMQAASGLQNALSNALQQRSFQNVFRPSSPGIFGSMAPGIGSGIGTGGIMGILKLLGLM